MAWSGSGVFTAHLADLTLPNPAVRGLWAGALTNGVIRLALFNSQVTPDLDAPRDLARYGWGTWLPAREVSDPGWPEDYLPLEAQPFSPTDGSFGLYVPGGLAVPRSVLPGIAGDLVYYDTPAEAPGIAFHDFGGSTDIDGQLTITWGTGQLVWFNAPL
jgi:hypothetical protein